MTTQNMYLYMFLQQLAGVKNLNLADPDVKLRYTEAEAILRTEHKILTMQQTGNLNKTEAAKLQRQVNNRRMETVKRIELMEDVQQKFENL